MKAPLSVLYGGAHRFAVDAPAKLSRLALQSLDSFAPDAATLATATGIDPSVADAVYLAVRAKLAAGHGLDDLRVDFEDGYGPRSDTEEDGHADAVAASLAAFSNRSTRVGVRIKSFGLTTRARALRTLERVVTGCVKARGGLPENFVVTLPKVSNLSEVSAFLAALDRLEHTLDLDPGTLAIELMIETPWSLVHLVPLVEASLRRLESLHLGAYDLLSSLGVMPEAHSLAHPHCEAARLKLGLVGATYGVRVSDGATTTLPVSTDIVVVHRGWRLHADNVRAAWSVGVRQGWDLHPSQLVARYAAVFALQRAGLDAALTRLGKFLATAAQATRDGAVFDDAATAQAVLAQVLDAMDAGLVTEAEVVAKTAVSVDRLRTRSFAEML